MIRDTMFLKLKFFVKILIVTIGPKCNSLYNLSLHVVYRSSKYARSFLLGLFIMVHGKTTDE